eukprot:gene427-394_t
MVRFEEVAEEGAADFGHCETCGARLRCEGQCEKCFVAAQGRELAAQHADGGDRRGSEQAKKNWLLEHMELTVAGYTGGPLSNQGGRRAVDMRPCSFGELFAIRAGEPDLFAPFAGAAPEATEPMDDSDSGGGFPKPCVQVLIPVFQRKFCWQAEPEAQRWWADLEARASEVFIDGDRGVVGHHVGNVVLKKQQPRPTSSDNRILVVDGQQRITTTMLYACSLRDAAFAWIAVLQRAASEGEVFGSAAGCDRVVDALKRFADAIEARILFCDAGPKLAPSHADHEPYLDIIRRRGAAEAADPSADSVSWNASVARMARSFRRHLGQRLSGASGTGSEELMRVEVGGGEPEEEAANCQADVKACLDHNIARSVLARCAPPDAAPSVEDFGATLLTHLQRLLRKALFGMYYLQIEILNDEASLFRVFLYLQEKLLFGIGGGNTKGRKFLALDLLRNLLMSTMLATASYNHDEQEALYCEHWLQLETALSQHVDGHFAGGAVAASGAMGLRGSAGANKTSTSSLADRKAIGEARLALFLESPACEAFAAGEDEPSEQLPPALAITGASVGNLAESCRVKEDVVMGGVAFNKSGDDVEMVGGKVDPPRLAVPVAASAGTPPPEDASSSRGPSVSRSSKLAVPPLLQISAGSESASAYDRETLLQNERELSPRGTRELGDDQEAQLWVMSDSDMARIKNASGAVGGGKHSPSAPADPTVNAASQSQSQSGGGTTRDADRSAVEQNSKKSKKVKRSAFEKQVREIMKSKRRTMAEDARFVRDGAEEEALERDEEPPEYASSVEEEVEAALDAVYRGVVVYSRFYSLFAHAVEHGGENDNERTARRLLRALTRFCATPPPAPWS